MNSETAGSGSNRMRFPHSTTTSEIIAAFYTVYNDLGFGFLENPYRNALVIELNSRGLRVQREVPVELTYLGQTVGIYRADLVVERVVLVETKASAAITAADQRQVLNYLRATNLPVGLLLHFGPKPAIKRFVWSGKQIRTS